MDALVNIIYKLLFRITAVNNDLMTLYPQTVSESIPCLGTIQASAGINNRIHVPLPCADKYNISISSIGIRGVGNYSGQFTVTKHQNFFEINLSTATSCPFGEYIVAYTATKI